MSVKVIAERINRICLYIIFYFFPVLIMNMYSINLINGNYTDVLANVRHSSIIYIPEIKYMATLFGFNSLAYSLMCLISDPVNRRHDSSFIIFRIIMTCTEFMFPFWVKNIIKEELFWNCFYAGLVRLIELISYAIMKI